MPQLLLDQPYIGQSEINECIALFKEIQFGNAPPEIQLTAITKIEDIDIALIGYFILFHEDENLGLTIKLELPLNDAFVGDVSFKLHQLGTYAYLLTQKDVFTVAFSDKTTSYNIHKLSELPESWYVLSTHFMLLLLVSKKKQYLYEILFEDPIQNHLAATLENGVQGVTWVRNSDTLYQAYNNELTNQALKSSTMECIVNLGRLAFYRSLRNIKVLNFFTDKRYWDNPTFRDQKMQASNLHSTNTPTNDRELDAYKYFESILQLIRDLSSKPLIYQFAFDTLTSSEVLPNSLNINEVKTFTERIIQLWKFTTDLIHSLKELAKNTRDHATTHSGIVMAKINTVEKFPLLSEGVNGNKFYKQYLEWHKKGKDEQLEALLDLRVFDLGELGVIPTLLNITKQISAPLQESNLLKKLLDEDAVALEEGSVDLSHLLSSNSPCFLNQQSKRSIAHLGLLTFSNLIEANNGWVIASSLSANKQRQNVTVPRFDNIQLKTIEFGTHYSILLPIVKRETYETHLPHSIQLPTDTSEEEIKGLERLFDYKLITIDCNEINPPPDDEGPYILSYKMPGWRSIRGRDDESKLWAEFNSILSDVLKKNSLVDYGLVHVDFEHLDINESQLFRFFGEWGNYYPKKNILVTNIPTDIYSRLLQVNDYFLEFNPLLDYWNSQSAIIVYHYVTDETGARFYFTDVLWGQTQDMFLGLNKSLHRNHFNAVSLTHHKSFDYNENKSPIPAIPATNRLIFYSRNVLLPFDLLFLGPGKTTLFEINAAVLLKNEMNP